MKVKVTDNFENICKVQNKEKCSIDGYIPKNDLHIDIYLDDIQSVNKIFFKNDKDLKDEFVASIRKIDDKICIKTGNYIGRFKFNNIQFDIYPRFGKSFIKRMLNFANDIYFTDADVLGKEDKNKDTTKLILYYLFIQKLQKVSLISFPKSYMRIKNHSTRFLGSLDINEYIKKDIPYLGKISTQYRKQVELQAIIDVIYKALQIIKEDGFSIHFVFKVYEYFKSRKSNTYINALYVQQIMKHKVFANPLYAPFKEVLRYAFYIIKQRSIEKEKGKTENVDFLINIADLFELYTRKLLHINFPDWSVDSPKIEVYESNYLNRKIIPDIVMIKNNKVAIFDVKYKRVENGVQREDFFQINTYMSYYANQGYDVICGGLLYPIERKEDKEVLLAKEDWFGSQKTKFIVDGITVPNEDNEIDFRTIETYENHFINRLSKFLKDEDEKKRS